MALDLNQRDNTDYHIVLFKAETTCNFLDSSKKNFIAWSGSKTNAITESQNPISWKGYPGHLVQYPAQNRTNAELTGQVHIQSGLNISKDVDSKISLANCL